jgi:hypothetical protein
LAGFISSSTATPIGVGLIMSIMRLFITNNDLSYQYASYIKVFAKNQDTNQSKNIPQ